MWYVYLILVCHIFSDSYWLGVILDIAAICVLATRKD